MSLFQVWRLRMGAYEFLLLETTDREAAYGRLAELQRRHDGECYSVRVVSFCEVNP